MIKKMTDWYLALAKKQQIFFAIGVIAIVLFALIFSYFVLRSNYQVLFSQLSNQDAAAVSKKLDAMKVDYRIAESGSEILVKAPLAAKLRLQLMADGLSLHNIVGFELFDKSDFGMTEFAQKVNYQRALQGELERTIISLNEVVGARVHLVLAKDSLFQQKQAQSKAAVTLKIKPNTRLTGQEILGIQRLVAASVTGLDAKDVVVLDDQGNVLSSNSQENNDSTMVNDRLDSKREMEAYLNKKVSHLLTTIFGEDKAFVRVNVSLNYNRIKRTSEKFLPANASHPKGARGVVSQEKASESIAAQSNNVERSDNQVQPAKNTTQEVSYKVSREVKQEVEAIGNIAKLSVSVVVPSGTSPKVIAEVKQLVTSAVGINEKRGDMVSVQALAAVEHSKPSALAGVVQQKISETPKLENKQPATKPHNLGMSIKSFLQANVLWVVLVACVIIICLLLLSLLRPKKKQLSQEEREILLATLKDWLDKGDNG